MAMVVQGSLFDADVDERDACIAAGHRRPDASTPFPGSSSEREPGSTCCPGGCSGADALFDRLLEAVPWAAERRRMYERVVDVPRLLAYYDEDAELPDPMLTRCARPSTTTTRPSLGEPLRTAGLCLYRDGRDSVAWHGDTIGRGRTEDTLVAIVSLGSPRQLALRPRAARRDIGSRSGTATWWSWAAPASAPGSTRCSRRPGPSGRGSACSSAPAGSGDPTRTRPVRSAQASR